MKFWRFLGRSLIHLTKWSIAIGVCAAGIWGLYKFKFDQISQAIKQAKAYPEPSEAVEIVRVIKKDYSEQIRVVGELVAPRKVTIQNELPGQVVVVNYRSGDQVQKGSVIVQLDISAEQADIESAKATLEKATNDHRRLQNLLTQKAIAPSELDTATESLQKARAKIKQLRTAITKKTLTAPYPGQLGIFQLSEGQFLNINSQVVTLIGDGQYMWVDFSVPQFYQGPETGHSIKVHPIENKSSKSPKSQSIDATIIAKDNQVVKESRSIKYRAQIPRKNYRPQQMFLVEVPVDKPTKYVAVPAMALRSDATGQHVFVLKKGEKEGSFRAEKRAVRVKAQSGGWVYLISGVTEGEPIASTGAFKLRNHILVYQDRSNASASDQTGGEK